MKRFLMEFSSSKTTEYAQLLFNVLSYRHSQWDMNFLQCSLLPLSPLISNCERRSEGAWISARILDVPFRITRGEGFSEVRFQNNSFWRTELIYIYTLSYIDYKCKFVFNSTINKLKALNKVSNHAHTNHKTQSILPPSTSSIKSYYISVHLPQTIHRQQEDR